MAELTETAKKAHRMIANTLPENLVKIEVEHEADKPQKIIKMVATKQFKKKHPKTGFGRTSEPVEVRDLPNGKKVTVYGFNII